MVQRRLSLIEDRHAQVETSALATIIRSYRNLIIRMYCHIRFRIIPLRFLQEMVQYIPRRGTVLDLGCGFGLFTLYYAKSCPDVHFTGIDLSRRRIQAAKRSARKLNLTNVSFVCQDAREYTRESGQRFDAVMTLDLLHHIPVPDGESPPGVRVSGNSKRSRHPHHERRQHAPPRDDLLYILHGSVDEPEGLLLVSQCRHLVGKITQHWFWRAGEALPLGYTAIPPRPHRRTERTG